MAHWPTGRDGNAPQASRPSPTILALELAPAVHGKGQVVEAGNAPLWGPCEGRGAPAVLELPLPPILWDPTKEGLWLPALPDCTTQG